MLEAKGINTFYGRSHVLFDVSLRVDPGEVVALLGRNGAGKTTTMATLVGFLRHRSGTISLDDTDLGGLTPFKRVRAGLAIVPQGGRIFAGLSVRENLEIVRGHRNGLRWTADKAFETFPTLADLAGRDAGLLSGGERQMLAVARALMVNPVIVLLDEPSEGLAPMIVKSVGALITQLKASGIGVLLAEQNHRFALGIADRAYLIEKGRIGHASTAAELRDGDELQRYLGT